MFTSVNIWTRTYFSKKDKQLENIYPSCIFIAHVHPDSSNKVSSPVCCILIVVIGHSRHNWISSADLLPCLTTREDPPCLKSRFIGTWHQGTNTSHQSQGWVLPHQRNPDHQKPQLRTSLSQNSGSKGKNKSGAFYGFGHPKGTSVNFVCS